MINGPQQGAQQWHLQQAARVLRAGGVVLHACEGVWGLACDPYRMDAVAKVLALKQREVEKGLVVIGANAEVFAPELAGLPVADQAMVRGSWPAAVSWVLPNVRFPSWVTGRHDTVVVRVPGHAQARALCAQYDGTLISTSANLSGKKPASSMLKAIATFNKRVGYIVPGEVLSRQGSSEIRTLEGATLRPGGH